MLKIKNGIEVSSLSQFVDAISNNPLTTWYRGEPSNFKELKLIPSVFRDKKYKEYLLFHSFKCRHYDKYHYYNDFQWLCLMQHYDLPTRLLDWTTNPFVALYFATEPTKSNGFLYSIVPAILNSKSESKGKGLYLSNHPFVEIRVAMMLAKDNFDDIFEGKIFNSYSTLQKENLRGHLSKYSRYPIAISPEIINNRMLVQSCCFTISGGTSSAREGHLPIQDTIDVNAIIIQSSVKKTLREQLRKFSINQSTLFPEFEYTSKYLKDLLTE
jgi:hypothetical protein